jgi:uncharacterized membrane protein (DUF4010 family)
LPIVPNAPIGPFGGVNPREVWVIAIALAGASFVGYLAIKYFGASHGMLLAGAAGGLVSSTAVAIANARCAASPASSPRLLAAGVAMASTVMFLRVCAIVLAMNANLIAMVAPPLLAAAAVTAAYALIATYWRQPGGSETRRFEFRNPFAFWPVIAFALFLGVMIVAGRIVSNWLGGIGAIIGAALVGLVDVDAVTVSLARLTPHPLDAHTATIAILSAAVTDTMSKIAIGYVIGSGRFAIEITVMALAGFAAGAAALGATLAILIS